VEKNIFLPNEGTKDFLLHDPPRNLDGRLKKGLGLLRGFSEKAGRGKNLTLPADPGNRKISPQG
jgi:hypothetical protein